jgi:hypothetical protein
VTTQGSDIFIGEKDKTQDVPQTAAVTITFDVEAQDSIPEQRRNDIPQRDPELTEEMTF